MTMTSNSNISANWIISPLVAMYMLPLALALSMHYRPNSSQSVSPLFWVIVFFATCAVIAFFIEAFALLAGWTAVVTRADQRSGGNLWLVLGGTAAFTVYVVGVWYAGTIQIH